MANIIENFNQNILKEYKNTILELHNFSKLKKIKVKIVAHLMPIF